jgi:hypothetical protein
MKIVFYLIVAFLLVDRVWADPNRYEWRSFGGANVGLQPLFAWWALVSRNSNQPAIDLTEMNSYKLVAISNMWAQLPPRPLPDWIRITSPEDKIVVVDSMWKLDATIEPAPTMVKHETIYLLNPPVKEIHDYKQARAARDALQNAQNQDVSYEDFMKTNIQAQADALRTNYAPSATSSVPGAMNYYAQTVRLQQNSVLTVSNMNSAHARTQYRDGQIAPFESFLNTFPDKNVYWLDHFAMRTGKKIDGLEVYDMGIATGLTY